MIFSNFGAQIGFCCLIFFAILQTVRSSLLPDPTPEFEGRIHLDAPTGVGVTPHPDLRRYLDNFPTCIPTVLPITNDSAYFEWDFKRQIIRNRLPVDRKLGQYYEIWMRLICLTGELHDFRVKIGASDVNQLAPHFQRPVYDFYVYKNRHRGDEIGWMNAKDSDIVIYNAMIDYYFLNDSFNFINVTQNGQIVLERDLCEIQRDLPGGNETKFYLVEAKACDYGSPQKCDTAILRMHIVGMTAPEDITILMAAQTYQIFCWSHPKFGTVINYSIHAQTETLVYVGDSKADRQVDGGQQCAILNETLVANSSLEVTIVAKNQLDSVPSETKKIFTEIDQSCAGECKNDGRPLCARSAKNSALEQFRYKGDPYCKCRPEYYGSQCQNSLKCPKSTSQSEFGVFLWRQTDVYHIAYAPCPYGTEIDAMMTRQCKFDADTGKAVWSEPNITDDACRKRKALLDDMAWIRSTVQQINPKDDRIAEAASTLHKNMHAAYTDPEIAQQYVKVISDVLSAPAEKVFTYNTGDNFKRVLEDYGANAELKPNEPRQLHGEQIRLEVAEVPPNRFAASADYSTEFKDKNVKVLIPANAFGQALRNAGTMHNQSVRVSTIFYQNSHFYQSPNYDNVNPVLVIEFPGVHLTNLSPPIQFFIPPNKFRPGNLTCVFWDPTLKDWSTTGMTSKGMDRFGRMHCTSSHLTGFSILFDFGYGKKIGAGDQEMLNMLSWIGCSLSMFSLLMTIVTYSMFRCLNRDQSGKILLNLCAAMFLMNFFFVLSSLKPFVGYSVSTCAAIGMFLHFATLASLLWMGVEAAHMYRMVVHVFHTSESFFMLKRCVIAWGVPLIIVLASAATDLGHYSTADDIESQYCQLSKRNGVTYYAAYMGPACLILFSNCVVFLLVIRALVKSTNAQLTVVQPPKQQKTTVTQVRGALGVMVLLGICWIFGAFAVGPARLPFMYIFCVLNSLQGFIIFLVRCLFYDEARYAWYWYWKTGKRKTHRGKIMTVSEMSSQNGYKKFTGSMSKSSTRMTESSAGNPTMDPTHHALLVENPVDDNEPITADTQFVRLLQGWKFIDEPSTPSSQQVSASLKKPRFP